LEKGVENSIIGVRDTEAEVGNMGGEVINFEIEVER
jgi:hypothetical protein